MKILRLLSLLCICLTSAAFAEESFSFVYDNYRVTKKGREFAASQLVTYKNMLCFLPLVAHKMYAVKQPFLGLSKTAVLFVFASVIVTNIGVFCYIKSLSLGEASRIAPLTSTYPLIAMSSSE